MSALTQFASGFARLSDCNSVTSDEERLEAQIKAASDHMCAAPSRIEKLKHWREMARLMDRRSVHRWRFLARLSEYEKQISPPSTSTRIAQASAERSGNAAGGVLQLHNCPGVMNPPQSAAEGCEAGNLITGDVMGMGHVHRAAKARPADAVPTP